jgi:hypothetical protein
LVKIIPSSKALGRGPRRGDAAVILFVDAGKGEVKG